MSLTLDEVRRVRFRMARRNAGYEVSDVDLFIDKVEATFQQFENERDLLRREAEASGTGGEETPGVVDEQLAAKDQEISAREEELARLREENERLRESVGAGAGEETQNHIQELSRRNDEMSAELERVRAELSDVRSQRVAEAVGQAETITVTTREEASPAVIRLVQLATGQAEQLVEEAEAEAARKLEEAKQQAREISTDARTKAERIESEARVNAEQMRSEAQQNAERVNVDADRRRHELFDQLEREREELSTKVSHLRDFEGHYRNNLRSFFEKEIEILDSEDPEPEDVPELVAERSRTPRLDALAANESQG